MLRSRAPGSSTVDGSPTKRARKSVAGQDELRFTKDGASAFPPTRDPPSTCFDMLVCSEDLGQLDEAAEPVLASPPAESLVKPIAPQPPPRTALETDELKEMLVDLARQKVAYPSVDPDFLTKVQPHLKKEWRSSLVEWLVAFPRELGICSNTVAAACVFLDTYLSSRKTQKELLQLVAMVAVFVATKIHEGQPITMKEMVVLSNGAYDDRVIFRMEVDMLQALDWHLHPVTAHDLVVTMLKLHPKKDEAARLTEMGTKVLDLSLCEYDNLRFDALTLAVSACLLAFATVSLDAAPFVERITRHVDLTTLPDLDVCMQALKDLHDASMPADTRERSISPTSVLQVGGA